MVAKTLVIACLVFSKACFTCNANSNINLGGNRIINHFESPLLKSHVKSYGRCSCFPKCGVDMAISKKRHLAFQSISTSTTDCRTSIQSGKNTRKGIKYYCSQRAAGLQLSMGFWDFFKSRQNDFIKLDKTQDSFGPGPLVIFYNVPKEIQDEELALMIQDGAPLACNSYKKGMIPYKRVYPQEFIVPAVEGGELEDGQKGNTTVTYHDLTVEQLLQDILRAWEKNEEIKDIQSQLAITKVETRQRNEPYEDYAPIIYFSGFTNDEMMKTYNIIYNEIFQETQGVAKSACAKVVPPALQKNVCQLFSEISKDHAEAMIP